MLKTYRNHLLGKGVSFCKASIRAPAVAIAIKRNIHYKNQTNTREITPRKPCLPYSRVIQSLPFSPCSQVFRRSFHISKAFLELPEHQIISLPALSPTMTTGTIAKWVVSVGDKVEDGDVINEIETDKATMEFETAEDGYIAAILIPEGESDVPVGKPMVVMVENEEDVAAFKDFKPEEGPAATTTTTATASVEEPVAATPTPPPAPAPVQRTSGEPIFASPFAKKLAASLGISLESVPGSGPNGRIVENDILSFNESNPSTSGSSVVANASALSSDTPVSGIRRVIASRLLESKTTVPHYYLTSKIHMDNALKIRKELNEKSDEYKISVNDLIVKASALACQDVPECNSSWQGDFIRQYHTVDVCVAVSTPTGLITPIVSEADRKGLKTISNETKDLASRAREGKLAPHEYQGGTFTVSNLGMFGSVSNFSAIVNPPQSCILAVGGPEKEVVESKEEDGGFVSTTVLQVTLSCDHRTVDGAVGAQWLKAFKSYMENPITMIL